MNESTDGCRSLQYDCLYITTRDLFIQLLHIQIAQLNGQLYSSISQFMDAYFLFLSISHLFLYIQPTKLVHALSQCSLLLSSQFWFTRPYFFFFTSIS